MALPRASEGLIAELSASLPLEHLLTRAIDRLAYTSDASHYALTPLAVVRAASEREVADVLRTASRHEVPVTFRSGGTSLSGQAVSDGLLVDTRRHFRDFEVLDGGLRVAVGVGLTVREVNARLARFGRQIGPDPASESACTIGGVIANNSSGMSCGTHSNAYSTLDSLVVVLPSGTTLDTAADDAEAVLMEREPQLYETLLELRDRLRSDLAATTEIRRQFAMKNTMGYALNAFVDHESVLDIFGHLLVGSEGTLGFIARAVLRTLPMLPHAQTGLLLFDTIGDAVRAVDAIAGTGARAIELMDQTSLRAARNDPACEDRLRDLLGAERAALLIEYQEATEESLIARHEAAAEVIAGLEPAAMLDLTSERQTRAQLWRIRKGLFTAVAGARPIGTSTLLEDVAVPPRVLAATCERLGELFAEYGYGEAAVFGHARDANLHFLLTQSFGSAEEVARYERFTEDLVDLVLTHGGTLKAEHGTGRMMAPFVRRQFGDDLYEVMRAVKHGFDPSGVLNPGVVIAEDARAHLENLKSVPAVDPAIDACVECGYCEGLCPSRNLTLTPRQRIVVSRALAALPVGDPDRERLAADHRYSVLDTCAADGMCATNCPVGIDTGRFVKGLRSERHGSVAAHAATAVAEHWKHVAALARTSLALAHRMPGRLTAGGTRLARSALSTTAIPIWSKDIPPAASAADRPNAPAAPNPAAVFFPSCLDAIFAPSGDGPGAARALLVLADRAHVPLAVPRGIDALCCATPWRSKGFAEGGRRMARRVADQLQAVTGNGTIPVITDASSCTHGLIEALQAAGTDIQVMDATTFAALHLLPRLTVWRRFTSLALHPTCATIHLGATETLTEIARAIADDSFVPVTWGCCGYAGDRGMLLPDLTAAATASQAEEINTQRFDGYASNNRTCEIGMTRATGKPYRHILEFLEEATRAELP